MPKADRDKFVIELTPIKGAGYHQARWHVHIRGGASDYYQAWNLAEAFRTARTVALELIKNGAYMVQVLKRDKLGKWREERTYPRAHDPKKSRG